MLLNRIVELQSPTQLRRLSDNQAEYEFLEGLVESQKASMPPAKHHYLIKTPFRYALPVKPQYSARFRPPFYGRNCFYGAEHYRTSAFEYTYHWLAERIHLRDLSQTPQPRTHFQVRFLDKNCHDLSRHPQIKRLMDKNDYTFSHEWIEAHPQVSSILYPSCRDPQRGNCIATFDLSTLGKKPRRERALNFIYQAAEKKCLIQDPLGKEVLLEVFWKSFF